MVYYPQKPFLKFAPGFAERDLAQPHSVWPVSIGEAAHAAWGDKTRCIWRGAEMRQNSRNAAAKRRVY